MLDVDKLAERLGAASSVLPSEEEPTEHVETVEQPEEEKEASPRPLVGHVTSANLFRHPDAHPIVLDLCLLKKYGPDFLLWEAETLEHRIPQDFHGSEVSDLNLAKIQACRTLHLVDTYWDRWEVFTWMTAAFNGLFPDFDSLQVPTLAQCAVSVATSHKIRDDVEWSSEVKTFLSQVFRFEGVFYPIPPLDFVPIDTDGFVVDADEIARLWQGRKMPLGESIASEQLRRLLLIQQALDEDRALLRSQLPLVEHA